jgi:hypothetical protein
MHPEHDPDLKAAFAELQRERRDQAPPFSVMRERAIREADAPRSSPSHFHAGRRLAWAATVACLVAVALWRIGHQPKAVSPKETRNNSMEHVDQLLTAIEQHLDFEVAMSSSEYPTDILLADYQPELFP